MNSYWSRFAVVSSLILFAILSRIIPHPPNFTPIAAMALFGGAYYTERKWAFIIPLTAMFISDLFIGFHSLMPLVYICFAVMVFIGFRLRENKKPLSLIVAGLTASILFFVFSNFGVWIIAKGTTYPYNIQGLMACYVAAIPFFQNTLLGDMFYIGVLFGTFEAIKYRFPVLRSS